VICRRPSGRSLSSLAVPSVSTKRSLAASPSRMNRWWGLSPITTEAADSRRRCRSGIASHMPMWRPGHLVHFVVTSGEAWVSDAGV
jgi:hypothetical protein